MSPCACCRSAKRVPHRKTPTIFPLLARLMVTAIMVMILIVILRIIVTVATLIAGAVPLRQQRSPPGWKTWTNRFALKRSYLLRCQVSSIAQEVT